MPICPLMVEVRHETEKWVRKFVTSTKKNNNNKNKIAKVATIAATTKLT